MLSYTGVSIHAGAHRLCICGKWNNPRGERGLGQDQFVPATGSGSYRRDIVGVLRQVRYLNCCTPLYLVINTKHQVFACTCTVLEYKRSTRYTKIYSFEYQDTRFSFRLSFIRVHLSTFRLFDVYICAERRAVVTVLYVDS